MTMSVATYPGHQQERLTDLSLPLQEASKLAFGPAVKNTRLLVLLNEI